MLSLVPLITDENMQSFISPSPDMKTEFRSSNIILLRRFLTPWALELLRTEALRLVDKTSRKDLFIEESRTWRHMQTMGSNKIREF